jgi:hypothetical protein
MMDEHKWLMVKITGILIFFALTLILAVDGRSRKRNEQEYDRSIYVVLSKQNELIERQNVLLKSMYEARKECNCEKQ